MNPLSGGVEPNRGCIGVSGNSAGSNHESNHDRRRNDTERESSPVRTGCRQNRVRHRHRQRRVNRGLDQPMRTDVAMRPVARISSRESTVCSQDVRDVFSSPFSWLIEVRAARSLDVGEAPPLAGASVSLMIERPRRYRRHYKGLIGRHTGKVPLIEWKDEHDHPLQRSTRE
jgi:hypothetical protein